MFGRASGFSADINLSTLDGYNGFRLDGPGSYTVSVSSAGDINGDGFDDVIIGAGGVYPYLGYPSANGYVVFGSASGFDATLNLSNLDGNNGFSLGDINDAHITVSNAGDINGDGFDDVIVGIFDSYIGDQNSISSYVIFGQAAGFPAVLSLTSLNGANGFRLDAPVGSYPGGPAVSNAGDVNGDGLDDLLVGYSRADFNGESAGASYVVFGKASGFSAAMDLSSLDGNNGFRLDGTAPGDRSGSSVSNAGDVNGDGFDDVIVGSPGAGFNGVSSGSSYVVFGKASGFSAAMDLSSLDGKNGFRLDGVAA